MEGRSRRRRERALRLAGQGGRAPPGSDEEAPAARPPPPRHRRRRNPHPLAPEEDIIDGFAIISFKSYDDIEICLKNSREKGAKVAATLTVSRERPPTPPPTRNNKLKRGVCGSPAARVPPPPGSSNEEPALVKRECADSEDNRLSDASTRCSSGRGYICDSEGEDDKASDAGSVFSTTPPPIKKEPITVDVKNNGVVNGHSGKGAYRNGCTPTTPVVGVVGSTNGGTVETAAALVSPKRERISPPPPAVPPPRVATPPPVATTLYQPLPPISTTVTSNESCRVSYYGASGGYPTTTAPSYHPPQPSLYAPYNSTPYLPPMGASSGSSKEPARYQASPSGRPPSLGTAPTQPVRHSPRPQPAPASPHHESYSSNVSSLSRGSVGTPVSLPPYGATQAAALAPAPLAPAPLPPPPAQPHHLSHQPHQPHQYSSKTVWSSSLGPGSGESQRTGLGHFAPTLFPPTAAAPQPPSQPLPHQPVNSIPFSAESLFQSSKFQPHRVANECRSDALRRELDTRFLVSQERGPFLRTEMHHHQHQHTHVHQHAPLLPVPPPPAASLYAAPIFKEMPKMDSGLFYRGGVGLAGYSPYSPAGLLTPSTPFAPPNHIPTFTPKQVTPEPSKPKPVKTGKWNAMHVRIAWEIYHHQQKGGLGSAADSSKGLGSLLAGKPPGGDLLRPPPAGHIFAAHHPFAPAPAHRPSFDPHSSPFPPVGGSVFGRYPAAGPFPPVAAYPSAHDPWARLQSARSAMGPLAASGAWTAAKAEEERERRARREEKQRRANAAKAAVVRDRSPHRPPSKETDLRPPPAPAPADMMRPHPPPAAELLRPHPPPPTAADLLRAAQPPQTAFQRQRVPILPPYHPPSMWPDPYRYDPLHFGAVPSLREEEEARAKLFGVFPGVGGLRAPTKAPSQFPTKEDPSR